MKKKILIIVIIATLLGLAVYNWLPFILIKTQFSQGKTPGLYAVPTERVIKTSFGDKAKSADFSYFGLQFKTPWGETIGKKELLHAVNLRFPQNHSLLIISHEDDLSVLESLLSEIEPSETKAVKNFFGEEYLKSNYSFYDLVLNTTPNQVTILTPRKEAVAKSILIILKTIISPFLSADSLSEAIKIYRFKINNIKGFQFGGSNIGEGILVEIFDEQDKNYDILIGGATQDEIDLILSSMESL